MSDETWVVALPKLGESVTEGVIGAIFKQVGDEVEFDDALFEVSTDKVDSEIPSPYDGVVLEVLAQPGETVPVGAPVLRIGGPGATVENRLPSASHAVAAAGGRSLAEPSAPSMGGSEGPAIESGAVVPPGTGTLYELTMPKLGESVTEGTIGNWFKQVGDEVAFDDALFEVSTDKVDSEIPSPYDGTLLEILVQAGETVPVGTVLARIGDASAPAAPPPGGSAQAPSTAASPAAPAATVPPAAGNGEGRLLSPLVRRLIAEHGIDPSTIAGSGVGGRIRREDVEAAIANQAARPAAPAAPAAAARPGRAEGGQECGRFPRRSGSAEPHAPRSRGHAESVPDHGGVGVDVGRGGLQQDRQGPGRVQGAVQERHRGIAELPAVHLPCDVRRTAGIPDGELVD